MTRTPPKSPAPRRTEAPPAGEDGALLLAVHVPGREVRTIQLERGRKYVLGRHTSADVVLEQAWVSAQHAIISTDEPSTITDLGGRNATCVDGQQLTPHTPRELRIGSVISIGGISLFVSSGEVRTSGVQRRVMPFGLDSPGAPSGRARPPATPVISDRGMWQLYAFAQKIAASSASVLITGETGVGKELMAQAIHGNSPRARRELVILNCAAMPESLVESELFGYERGAFSGAASPKAGLFEAAHGSTFFLDEIGELPLSVQAKLLRVLETGDVLRLGSVRPTRVDVRIVTATNRNLQSEVARGAFRADLFYRLNGLTIAIPPLRERLDDIEELARHFAANSKTAKDLRFSKAALAALRAHPWPGNVRELKSVVDRAALMNQGGLVEPEDLMLDGAPTPPPALEEDPRTSETGPIEYDLLDAFPAEELPTSVVRAELERREIRRTKEALQRTAGNQTEAARLLGVSRRTLMNRMDRFGINRPRKGPGRGGTD